MATGGFGIWGYSDTGTENSFKKLRFLSSDHMAFVEIQLGAKVIDERGVEYNYNQEDITSSGVDLPLKQGEIKLTTWNHNLGIEFDFVATEDGFELTLYWATFGDENSTKMYHIESSIIISIPMGSSSFQNLKAEYDVFPEPLLGQKISLHVKEAFIHLQCFAGHYDLSLKRQFDEIFDDEKTVNIESVFRSPRNHIGY